jgi:hypothetical protein
MSRVCTAACEMKTPVGGAVLRCQVEFESEPDAAEKKMLQAAIVTATDNMARSLERGLRQ